MLVVHHESVGVVAFSPWAAFELHLEQPLCRARDREFGRGSFGCRATASVRLTLYQTKACSVIL